MEDDDPDTVERMLEYSYTYDYDGGSAYNLVEESRYSEEQEVDKEDETSSVRTSQSSSSEIERTEAETDPAAPVSVEPDDPLLIGGVSEGNPVVKQCFGLRHSREIQHT